MNLVKIAKEKGICSAWAKKLKRADLEEQCNMFFDGMDWAIENNFPPIEYLRSVNATAYGIYTDHIGDINNVRQVGLFGNSKVNLFYSEYSVAKVVARDSSILHVKAIDNSIVYVELFDDSLVYVEGNGVIKVYDNR